MNRACWDIFQFTEQSGRDLAAEYLLSVRVAEAIAQDFGSLLKVHLEMKTRKFATHCFPLMKYVQTGDRLRPRSVLRERKESTVRPGRIDVAVMRDGPGDEQPVCAIEIKRLNPSDKLVREDLERNAAYFSLRNQIDDRTLIEFAAFAALHRYRPGYRTQDLEKARRLYERRAGKIALPTGVCRTVQVFQVDKLEEPVYNFEVEEVDQEAYMLMGIVVVFHWAEHGDDEPSRQPIGEVA
jgi:hypothetical protein